MVRYFSHGNKTQLACTLEEEQILKLINALEQGFSTFVPKIYATLFYFLTSLNLKNCVPELMLIQVTILEIRVLQIVSLLTHAHRKLQGVEKPQFCIRV